jgi:hypothetical protein
MMDLFKWFKPKKIDGASVLAHIPEGRGLLWDKIQDFQLMLAEVQGAVTHQAGTPQSPEMQKHFPLKQHLEGGLYTRELFMPKDSFVISMIHKQQHPSFLLKGKVSYLDDEGNVVTVTGPHTIFTQIGTQRVLYIHEDTNWCCVYKTDAKTFEEAEADVYADTYSELPEYIIERKKALCLD